MRNEARTYATFVCDSPDEPEFSDGGEGDPIRPGGRELAEFIRRSLGQSGIPVSDLDQHEYYGWSFHASSSSVPVWCLLQFCEPWLLITTVDFRFWHQLRGRRPDEQHAAVCRQLHSILSQSSRITDLRWFTCTEFARRKGSDGSAQP